MPDAAAAPREPEAWLGGLDPIGWRFGLERIQALLAELGDPQLRFRAAHVVGTNGKSSVTAMAAALLEAHGHATGAYVSPHVERWAERISLRGAEIGPEAFAGAVRTVAAAARKVEARLGADERVTQFEAATAVAFVAFAAARVDIAVVEAGLGGRLDATNVLASEVTALTSVGLDHTEWLGGTEEEIAAEKLAVLREGTTLITGELPDPVARLARRTARERGARLVVAHEAGDLGAGWAPYLRRNLGVALEVARVLSGELDESAVERALRGLTLPGRAQRVEGEPPLVLDVAHNPQGAAALVEALGELEPGKPVVACVAVLADKDYEAIVAELAPALHGAVCCELPARELAGSGRPRTQPVPAERLARACEERGVPAMAQPDPAEAVATAVELARELPGVALLTGSHYLLRYEWIARRAQSSSR